MLYFSVQPIWEEILRDSGWFLFPGKLIRAACLKAVTESLFSSSVLILNSPHPWLAQLLAYLVW